MIAFRVDGGAEIGMGHIIRCLALADKLREDTQVLFLMKEQEGMREVSEWGFEIERVEDMEAEWNKIKALYPKLLITDIKDIGSEWIRMVRDFGVPVLSITDLTHIQVCADIVINGYIGFLNHNIKVNEFGSRCYIGPKYMILRENFAALPKKKINERVRKVLVTVGGCDLSKLVLKAIRALDLVEGDFRIEVVLGPAFLHYGELTNLLKKVRKEIKLIRDTHNMASLMVEADIAVSGGGITLYELAAAGTPAIIISQIEHQLENARAFDALGLSINMGLSTSVDESEIAKGIEKLMEDVKLRSRMSQRAKEIIDGQGLFRVKNIVDEIFKLKGEEKGEEKFN